MWTETPGCLYILIAPSNLKNYKHATICHSHCKGISLASSGYTVSKGQGKAGMRLIKRLIGRGYMRRTGQFKFTVWNPESGKREGENKNLCLSRAVMPKKYVLRIKSKQNKIYYNFFILYICRKAFSV